VHKSVSVFYLFFIQQDMETMKIYLSQVQTRKKQSELVNTKMTLLACDKASRSHGVWLWLPAAAIMPI
jgi:hypothetical protein